MSTIRCFTCKQEKDMETCFYKASSKRYGYQEECKDCKRIRDKEYRKTSDVFKGYQKSPRFVFNQLQYQARKRNIVFELTLEYYKENLAYKPCRYCGSIDTKHWIDRINNDHSIGYTEANSAPCCELCNKMKIALEEQTFIKHCKAVSRFNS